MSKRIFEVNVPLLDVWKTLVLYLGPSRLERVKEQTKGNQPAVRVV